MKNEASHRNLATYTGDKVATTSGLTTVLVKVAIRDFIKGYNRHLAFIPELEFGLFNRTALEPTAVFAVRSDIDMSFPGVDRVVQEPCKHVGLFSYRALLEDVIRPKGSFGRVLGGMRQSTLIYQVPATVLPSALKALPQVQLSITAVVCDETRGLEIWVKLNQLSWRSYSDAQYGVMQTMRGAGIDGVIKEPESQWMIPASIPMDTPEPKAHTRRLLFACCDPNPLGMALSNNILADVF